MKEQAHKRLNVGCGFDYRPGYVNVDMHQRHGPDVVADVLDLATFPSGFYEELVAQDVLEHVARSDVRRALFEWNRVLAVGGQIFVRTTELGGLVRALEAPEHQGIYDQERLIQNVFGTQAYQGDFHLSGFTEPLFRFYMWEAGFEVSSITLHQGVFLDAHARKLNDLGFELDRADTPAPAFVSQLFRAVLGREPNPEELRQETAALDGTSRRSLIMKLLLSDERKEIMARRVPPFPRALHRPGLLRRVARRAKRLVKAAVAPLR
ncbi:MAG: methyltransferase domain-containing protein [Archangium sp.]|nr:methyltransferase domain-containing protein [Archangium sp.]MDP3151039.1 methyltransferase domain-containing protein [Archangium sp.]MDP3569788.1 methyltransferase domain-containing protein [Archangium sp.]